MANLTEIFALGKNMIQMPTFDLNSIFSFIFGFFSQYSLLGIGMIIGGLVIFLIFMRNLIKVIIIIAIAAFILKLFGVI